MSNSQFQATHGMSGTPEYRAWLNLKQRCFNPNNPEYIYYGARGITVCDRWKDSFENFYADMGPRPSENHSIERQQVNGNYEPNNCIWALPIVQASNRRTNVYHEIDGQRLTEAEISRRYGVSVNLIRSRLSNGLDISAAVAPVKFEKTFTHDGQTKTLKEWADSAGIPYPTLYSRLNTRGWSFEKAITKNRKN